MLIPSSSYLTSESLLHLHISSNTIRKTTARTDTVYNKSYISEFEHMIARVRASTPLQFCLFFFRQRRVTLTPKLSSFLTTCPIITSSSTQPHIASQESGLGMRLPETALGSYPRSGMKDPSSWKYLTRRRPLWKAQRSLIRRLCADVDTWVPRDRLRRVGQ